ncbi:type II toxin-antitoxin system RelE/ParE family toxin [Moorena producens JHB]|uniref:Type II toxin-antitoxin system RelE/ParE family toxin n=1 Tax=Moorena producens (strain JHB) TaxID=1454205 RepID=A0A1D9FW52_MOOP1|nr:type II toxin-antitoxin system RelE/ParE family toxin [Moorena producens]AOY79602.1 type II toxin-antitoxin system RelE/ParE family toxin [Moorena producens JHB]
MLRVNLSRQAAKFIKKLSTNKHARQIATKITELRKNPYPPDSIKLKGYSYYRTDNGEYRIVYQVQEEILEILLIDKRNDDEVYKQLKRKY